MRGFPVTDQIPTRSWAAGESSKGRRSLVLSDTMHADTHVLLSLYLNGVGHSARLTPTQLREIAADLVDRADLMEGRASVSERNGDADLRCETCGHLFRSNVTGHAEYVPDPDDEFADEPVGEGLL